MTSLREVLIQFVTDACEDKLVTSLPQVKDLFKLGLFGLRQTQRVASEAETRRIWDPEAWEQIGLKLTHSERFKGAISLQKTCQKLYSSQLQTPVTKRKAADTSGDEAADPPKVKKKKVRT
jgi:DNA polymerase phi